MDTIIATNVLFYILSIFIVCLTVGFAAFIIHIIKILKGVIAFLDVIKEESEKIVRDVENIKTKLTSGGAAFASFIVNILSFLKDRPKPEKKSKK
jgi:uncharacterized membrane protein